MTCEVCQGKCIVDTKVGVDACRKCTFNAEIEYAAILKLLEQQQELKDGKEI